jgi:YidC/Oxa1 family membrane protein insertase
MEKRVVAAIAISIAILFAFRYFEERRAAQVARQRPPVTQTTADSNQKPTVQAEAKPVAAPAPIPIPELPAEQSVPARQVVIQSDLYRAVLDNRGAILTSWQLKKFKTGRGEIFEMIPTPQADQDLRPGSLVFEDGALSTLANAQNYAVEIIGGIDAGGALAAPVTVLMRLRRGDLLIEKRYQFEAANYLVRLSANLQRGSQSLRGRLLLGEDVGPDSEHLLNPSIQLAAVSDLGGKIQRDTGPKDEKEIKPIAGDVRWVGLDLQYFAEIAIPAQALASFDIQRIPIKIKNLAGQEIERNRIRLTLPAEGSTAYKLYIGPKSQEHVDAVPGADLSRIIDFGTYLGILVKPLLIGLRWINRYTNNYGYAIILLTFILTLVLFPIRLKQMISMKKMQVLQPKIKEIQERYKRYKKTDPKRAEMNQEVMAVYKQHNVNPLGGCLPMLLQMPILFAFYRLLNIAIELRQAPFVGWLADLSAKDPYYILPIVMGITMLISQKMTPMAPSTDPVQAKMMLLMPAVMTFFFLNVSSGLNLYFLCSNVFQIAFQKVAEGWVGDQRPERKSKS